MSHKAPWPSEKKGGICSHDLYEPEYLDNYEFSKLKTERKKKKSSSQLNKHKNGK